MNPELVDLANTIYSEDATGNRDNMILAGSTVLNRLDSGRVKEFGGTIQEITSKGYHGKMYQNDPYKWASSGKFPDKESEERYKEALQIASGLMTGKIERQKGLFFFTDDEIKKLNKQNEERVKQGKGKVFDFEKTEEIARVGGYSVQDYKKEKPKEKAKEVVKKEEKVIPSIKGKFNEAFAEARRRDLKEFYYDGQLIAVKMK